MLGFLGWVYEEFSVGWPQLGAQGCLGFLADLWGRVNVIPALRIKAATEQ